MEQDPIKGQEQGDGHNQNPEEVAPSELGPLVPFVGMGVEIAQCRRMHGCPSIYQTSIGLGG